MSESQRAGDAPIGIDVVEGKSYYWCTCGKSSKQPFCDGSHKGSNFNPSNESSFSMILAIRSI